jgi:hypothetical protein
MQSVRTAPSNVVRCVIEPYRLEFTPILTRMLERDQDIDAGKKPRYCPGP